MYQTFVRMCAAYVRWKRAFASERQRLNDEAPPQHEPTPASMARRATTQRASMQSLVGLERLDKKAGVKPRGSVLEALGGKRASISFIDPQEDQKAARIESKNRIANMGAVCEMGSDHYATRRGSDMPDIESDQYGEAGELDDMD